MSIGKEFLFGDAFGNEDIGNLNLARVSQVDRYLYDDSPKRNNQKRKESSSSEDDVLPSNEKDLKLEVICIQDGEKIYKLSDLLIPIDQKKVKKIEAYMNREMTAPERDKNDKDEDLRKREKNEDFRKKEKNEKKEIANLIKKSRHNQKFCKVNITHNEKFFDKTLFLDNMKNDKEDIKATGTAGNNIRNLRKSSYEVNKEKLDYSTSISNELFNFKENFNKNEIIHCNNDNVTNNLNTFNQKTSYEDDVLEGFNSIMKTTINAKLNNNNMNIDEKMSSQKKDDADFRDVPNSPQRMEIGSPVSLQKQVSPFQVSSYVPHKDGQTDSVQNPTSPTQFENFNKTFQSSNPLLESLNTSNLFLRNKEFTNASFKRSSIINMIKDKENVVVQPMISKYKDEKKGNNFSFTINQSSYDNYDLFDYTKKKRNRAEGYYNPAIEVGSFKKSYLVSCEVTPQYQDMSKLIYDLNDYNMNFEILESSDQMKEEKKEISNNEDFFNSLAISKIKSLHSNQLKIGNSKGNLITHAKCSYNFTYNKINLTYNDLGEFHRPNFCKWMMDEKQKRKFSIVIGEGCDLANDTKNKHYPCYIVTKSYLQKKEKKLLNKNIQYMNAYEIFKDKKKLSLFDGKFCLFEHIDEYPLFVSNFGMASKMRKYLYSPKLFALNMNANNTKLTDVELKTFNALGPHGAKTFLQPNQKVPLLGQIDQNEIKGINTIDNNMFRAPVFYEKIKEGSNTNNCNMPKNKKRYNFLLTMKKGKDGKQCFYIRELEHLYTVAQEEPKIEVYPPQSRQYNNFLKNKIETYTYKLYNEIGYKAGINFKVFTNLFPAVTEQVLKKNFKEMNIEIDQNICYFTKIPNEINQSRITPENICQFESCQFGIYKLREVGITNLTNADKISYATNKFTTQTPDLKQQYLAGVIEEELLTTPWNITQNYLQSKQIKGMLAIKGIGDPSNGNGGYSFLKMPVKSYNENKTLKEEMDVLKNQNKNIKTVTGTDADLRKLSKEEIKIKLIQLGVEEESIKNLSRWGRVDLLRNKSSKAVELGYEGEITKYARNQRFNTKTQREEYQRNINEVFKKQINYIINNPSLDVSDDESSDDDKNINQYADYTENQNEYYYNDEDNNKKSMAFMRNVIYPNKKKKPNNAQEKSIASKRSNTHKKDDESKIIKVYNKSPNEESSIRIKLEVGDVDLESLRQKSKGKNFDSIYEYEMDKGTNFKRKRRDTPEKLFNETIGDIIDLCIRSDMTKLFLQPVKKKDYPDYFYIVKEPIDLGTMKNKTKRSEYKSINDFIHDLDTLIHNSELYNGDLHDVTQQARKLKDIAVAKIEESKESLTELETKIASEISLKI